MNIKEANLLAATEDYIVQQNACLCSKPKGLSQAIAGAFPHGNPYTTKGRSPGTTVILGNGLDQRYVACLFAQVATGKPGSYNSHGTPDSAKDREQYFVNCLERLAEQISHTASVAIPYKIGCGLAGGNWKHYEAILNDWMSRHPGLRVVLYKI